jgi:large subunit ribosomal protein L30e
MITRELVRAAATGKILFGYKIAQKKAAEAKAFIVSSDCREKDEMQALADNRPVHVFNGTSIELGAACGKPFGVSVVTILDEGKSNLMTIVKR